MNLTKDNYQDLFTAYEGYVNWGDAVKIKNGKLISYPSYYWEGYPEWTSKGLKMECVHEPKPFHLKKDGKSLYIDRFGRIVYDAFEDLYYISGNEIIDSYYENEPLIVEIPYKCHRLESIDKYGLGEYSIKITGLQPVLGTFDCPLWIFSHKDDKNKLEYDMPEIMCNRYRLFNLIPLWKKHYFHFAVHQYLDGVKNIAKDVIIERVRKNDIFEIISNVNTNYLLSKIYIEEYYKDCLTKRELYGVELFKDFQRNFADFQFNIILNTATMAKPKKGKEHSYYIQELKYEPLK